MSEVPEERENKVWKLLIEYLKLEKFPVKLDSQEIVFRDNCGIQITVFKKTTEGFFDNLNYEKFVGMKEGEHKLVKEDFYFDEKGIEVANLIELQREFGTRRRCIKLHSTSGVEKILITGKCIGFPSEIHPPRVYIISSVETN